MFSYCENSISPVVSVTWEISWDIGYFIAVCISASDSGPQDCKVKFIFYTFYGKKILVSMQAKHLKKEGVIETAPFPPAQLTNQGHAQFPPIKENSNHSKDDEPSD